MNCADQRYAPLLHPQQTVTQALVVMYDVVRAIGEREVPDQTSAKRIRFRKTTCQHREPFEEVGG